eukprot:m.71359 g.71359  ORF g.71359 m.71359 type:complete len:517 (+) comp12239_c0_seq2:146-1696(+)
MPKSFERSEVARHNKPDDLWVIIDGSVYDLSKFRDLHPGGSQPLVDVAGQDATELFYSFHRGSMIDKPKYAHLKIGEVASDTKHLTRRDINAPVPYGEPHGFWRKKSPYYRESHQRFRQALRSFIDKEIMPTARDDDMKGIVPSKEINVKLGKAGILLAVVGSSKIATDLMERHIPLPGGVKSTEYDQFHELILAEEMKRHGYYGLSDGLIAGISIGLPPILKFGSPSLQERIVPDIVAGTKRICLAITEPYAGSDVARIKTTAQLNPAGTHFIVSGVKKWITGGMVADYFTTLCNTDKGPVLLVIERDDDTVDTRAIPTSYSAAAGTSYVQFMQTVVPVENVIGSIGNGFKYAMANFNKERWIMAAGGNRLSRLMVEECIKWASVRKVFGKYLIQQPVIRQKLALMAAEVEAVHSLIEDVTYQMTQMSEKDMNTHLAGPIALLKFKQTRVANLIADNACQVFGGRAITKTGMGTLVEVFNRTYKMQSILGGSEEILADLAIRQAMRQYPATVAKL